MPDTLSSPDAQLGTVWTVSELNREARALLEQGLPSLAVSGEISNLARPQSGHVYFSLKDAHAQIRCAFFRQRQRRLQFRPENGDEVIVFGRVSLYEPRGEYQLIVDHIEASGEGALQRQFDELKRKLAAEGLFDQEHKRSPPLLPKRIGVVTSATGAAIRDILQVLSRRFPAVPVRIYPVAVQGAAAPSDIAMTIALAATRRDCDVLILARGGGTLEDLWAFNEEIVARAIAACPIPVISGIGHETDFTIADFVADIRAPTPSGAAEMAVPDQADWLARLNTLAGRLERCWQRRLTDTQQRLDWLARQLSALSPAAMLSQRYQRLREVRIRLNSGLRQSLVERWERLYRLRERLQRVTPANELARRGQRLERSIGRLGRAIQARLGGIDQRLALAARALRAVSPLATLARGYAIVTEPDSGRVIRRAKPEFAGSELDVKLAHGRLLVTVDAVHESDEAP